MPAAPITTAIPSMVQEAVHTVELRCFSYEERRGILTALLEAMTACGCWIADKRAISTWQMEFTFEAELSVVDELYSEMVAAGIEFTREAHLAMTWLCTLRRHRAGSSSLFRTVRVRLEMSFLQECEPEMGMMTTGFA